MTQPAREAFVFARSDTTFYLYRAGIAIVTRYRLRLALHSGKNFDWIHGPLAISTRRSGNRQSKPTIGNSTDLESMCVSKITPMKTNRFAK